MMKQLESLIEKLNTDVLASVTVFDKDSGKYIHRNILNQQIIDQYGSAEDFFEDLNSQGYKNLTLHPKRKNGNSFKIDGLPFDVQFGKKQKTKMEKPTKKSSKKKKKNKSFGLGAAEIFDLKLGAYEKERISKENEALTLRNKELEVENKQLLEEKMQRKFTVEKNDSLNNAIAGGFKQLPAIMKGLGFNVPVEASGLNAPVIETDYSSLNDLKRDFIAVVKNGDDDLITLLQVIYNKINQNIEPNVFAHDLQELLQKHNMIL